MYVENEDLRHVAEAADLLATITGQDEKDTLPVVVELMKAKALKELKETLDSAFVVVPGYPSALEKIAMNLSHNWRDQLTE